MTLTLIAVFVGLDLGVRKEILFLVWSRKYRSQKSLLVNRLGLNIWKGSSKPREIPPLPQQKYSSAWPNDSVIQSLIHPVRGERACHYLSADCLTCNITWPRQDKVNRPRCSSRGTKECYTALHYIFCALYLEVEEQGLHD